MAFTNSIEGDKIAKLITNEIKSISSEINNISKDEDKSFNEKKEEIKNLALGAIADGIYEYSSSYYDYDVQTNGTATRTATPFDSKTISDVDVDGQLLFTQTSSALKELLKVNLAKDASEIQSSDAQTLMNEVWKSFFDTLKTWLSGWTVVTTGEDNIGTNFIVGPVGIGTVNWDYNSSDFSSIAVNDLTEFYGSSFIPSAHSSDDLLDETWERIGKQIHLALNENTVSVPVDAGTPNDPSPGIYVGSEFGSLVYQDSVKTITLSKEEAEQQSNEVQQEVLESKAQTAYDKEYEKAIDEGDTVEEAEIRAQAAYDDVIESGL